MKKIRVISFVFAAASAGFYGCQKNSELTSGPDPVSSQSIKSETQPTGLDKGHSGAVYVLSNQVAANEVLVYSRSSDGSLSAAGSFPTGGRGTGSGLGSQGSLILQQQGENGYLYAVNAGSDDVTVFRVEGRRLIALDRISSHGTTPISVTAHGNLLYVVNAGGSGNISGFRIADDGHLRYVENSTKPLSSDAAGPAEIHFNNAGTQLVVTEKNTNRIITYAVNGDGSTDNPSVHPSVGTTPFGFNFDNHDQLFVTDAFGGAAGQSAVTSYDLDRNGNLSLIDGPSATHQTSACWIAITDDGRYCYSANTGSATISGYRIQNGRLSLLNSNGVTATTGTTPGDITLSNNSKFLYNLNSTSRSITLFKVNDDGSLASLGSVNNLPLGAVGIAAK